MEASSADKIEKAKKTLVFSENSATKLVEYYVNGTLIFVKRNNIPIYSRRVPLWGPIATHAEIYWDKKLVLQIVFGSCTVNRIHSRHLARGKLRLV